MVTFFKKNYAYFVLPLAVLILYWRTFGYGFIWDDYSYIVQNNNLGQGTDFFKLWFSRTSVDFWPITYSTLWVLKYLFLINPFYYHITNLIAFGISVVLLFKLLKLLGFKNAFLLVLIFSIHPMNTVAATWIFQLKTNLANCFGLLACIFFIKFSQTERKTDYGLSILFVLASFFSKVSWIMIPLMLLVYLFTISKYTIKKNILLTLPFFVLSAVIGVANVLWDSNALPVPESELILNKDMIFRLVLVGQNFIFYVYQIFFPANLMFVHTKVEPNLNNIYDYIPSFLLIVVSLAALFSIWSKNKFRYYSAGFLFTVFFLLPVLGLSEIYYMRFTYVAEHYLTVGMMGLLIPVVLLLLSNKFSKLILCGYFCFLIFQTVNYLPEFENEEKLFNATAIKNPNNILPHNVLGLLYKNKGEHDKAMFHYDRSIQIHPNAASYFNKAQLYELSNQYELARVNYEKAIELNPYVANSYNSLAVLYSKMKNKTVAIQYFEKAILADPTDARFYYNIGYTYEEISDYPKALEWYNRALTVSPNTDLFKEAKNRIEQKLH